MVTEAFIPEKMNRGYMFRLWNNTVLPFHRKKISHCHLPFEIVLFKSGNGTYSTMSGTHDIHAGDIFVFASNEQHCITDIYEGEDFKFMNIHFEPRYVWGSSNNGLSNDAMNMCFSHSDSFCNRLPRNNPHTDKVRRLAFEIEQELEAKEPEYQLMVHNKVYEILVILVRHLGYGAGQSVTAEEYRHIKAARKAIDYINRHLSEELSLDGLAKMVDLSPNYFSHIFKKTAGISLWDYITSKRIELAMAMLHDQTDRNMLDIAADCGFNNSANFNKMFRKVTGLTPTEFRRHGEYIG
ncbi:MAG: helix-turn-helix domain-containing protein [Clostridia bacterium]|nr:helix-turn-helix domain-containing protein [Clostridia bacterium]